MTTRMPMRLADWAKREGINLRTAQRMHARGQLPVPSSVTDTGRIIVMVPVDQTPLPADREELLAELRDLEERASRIKAKLHES